MSYEVRETEFGVLVFGSIPIDDMVALSKVWEARGLKYLAPGVSSALKATMAVTGDVKKWQDSINKNAQAEFPSDAEVQWLRSADVGISSKTLFSVLCRETLQVAAKPSRPDVPQDLDDFGRCYRLLQKFPEWKARLPEVAVAHPRWQPFVDQWAIMEAMFFDAIVRKATDEMLPLGAPRPKDVADDLYKLIRKCGER